MNDYDQTFLFCNLMKCLKGFSRLCTQEYLTTLDRFKMSKSFLEFAQQKHVWFFVTFYCKNGPLLWQNAKKAFLSFWCFKNGCFLFGQVALQAIFIYVMKLLLAWAGSGGWQKWFSNYLLIFTLLSASNCVCIFFQMDCFGNWWSDSAWALRFRFWNQSLWFNFWLS